MKCQIKREGLQTFFDIDGKKVMPSAYMSYNPVKENIEDFKKIGVNTFMFPAYAGDEGINMESGLRPFFDNFFKGYGEYDFSAVEQIMEMICPNPDEEIYIIPRVCLEPPIWWQREHPDEVARDWRGEPQRECFASKKWREDMTVALFALIDYFQASKWKDKVIGIHIAAGGTEEWAYQCRYNQQYYDYSEVNRQAYISWLKEKYQTEKNLSKAWGESVKDFQDITFPKPAARTYAKHGFLRNPETEMPVLDYYDFHNEIVADTINYFCRRVKEYTNNTKITGVFYGYVFSMPHNKKGLHALQQVIECPWVDFISTTNVDMTPGNSWVFASAVHSAMLHGKMWIAEGDIRTHLTCGLDKTMPHAVPDNDYYSSSVWVGPETPELSCSAVTKGLSRILTANCGIWWFDMFGGWLKDERLLSIIQKTSDLLCMQKNNYLKADVAIIIDEKGYKYFGINERQMAAAMCELISSIAHMGAMYHIYLQSDIKEDAFPADDYKLYIFAGGVNMPKEDKTAIEQKLKNKDKTLLFLHSASYYDSEFCGFTLKERETDLPELAEYFGSSYPQQPIPTFSFAEDEGYVLSRFAESRKPAVLWKDMGNWASVYSLHLAPHPHLLREIALMSGVHLYNLADDCIYAGGEFVALHATEGGYRRISLPEAGFQATNALTGEEIKVNDMFIDLHMKQYETVLIHVTK